MSTWLKWVLGVFGVGAASFVAYEFIPLPGMRKLGAGSVVRLRPQLNSPKVSNPIQITGLGGAPGVYRGTRLSDKQVVDFRPADIWSVVQKAPSIPILAGCE